MGKFRYDPSAARTLAAAVGRPASAHDYVLTDTTTGAVKGIYATEALAAEAFARLIRPGVGALYVLTVLHPVTCDCPEEIDD